MGLNLASLLPRRPAFLALSLACTAVGAYLLGNIVYNLFFHPLRKYPGPLLCRISKLPWV